MKRPSPAPAPKARTLAQQQSDFTSEGAPPPGKVSTNAPETKVVPTPQPCAPVTARDSIFDPTRDSRTE